MTDFQNYWNGNAPIGQRPQRTVPPQLANRFPGIGMSGPGKQMLTGGLQGGSAQIAPTTPMMSPGYRPNLLQKPGQYTYGLPGITPNPGDPSQQVPPGQGWRWIPGSGWGRIARHKPLGGNGTGDVNQLLQALLFQQLSPQQLGARGSYGTVSGY